MLSNLDSWDYNDFHELYIVKCESMKKSYDGIVKKLQKERMKYMKPTQQEETHPSEFIK